MRYVDDNWRPGYVPRRGPAEPLWRRRDMDAIDAMHPGFVALSGAPGEMALDSLHPGLYTAPLGVVELPNGVEPVATDELGGVWWISALGAFMGGAAGLLLVGQEAGKAADAAIGAVGGGVLGAAIGAAVAVHRARAAGEKQASSLEKGP